MIVEREAGTVASENIIAAIVYTIALPDSHVVRAVRGVDAVAARPADRAMLCIDVGWTVDWLFHHMITNNFSLQDLTSNSTYDALCALSAVGMNVQSKPVLALLQNIEPFWYSVYDQVEYTLRELYSQYIDCEGLPNDNLHSRDYT